MVSQSAIETHKNRTNVQKHFLIKPEDVEELPHQQIKNQTSAITNPGSKSTLSSEKLWLCNCI